MLGLIVKRTTNNNLLQIGSFAISKKTTENHSPKSEVFEKQIQNRKEQMFQKKREAIEKETALLKIELKQLLKDKIASGVKKNVAIETTRDKQLRVSTNSYQQQPTDTVGCCW